MEGDAAADQRAVADAIFAAWQAWRIALMDPSQENEERLAETTTGELLRERRESIASFREHGEYSTVNPTQAPSLTVLADSIEILGEGASARGCWLNSEITMRHAPEGDTIVNDEVVIRGWTAEVTLVGGHWLLSGWSLAQGLMIEC